MTKLLRRLRYLLSSRRRDRELAEELEFHREMLQDELQEDGLQDGEYPSRRAIGNLTRAREDVRAVWIAPWLETVWQDVVYALRSLGREPGFTAVALVTLGAAIGLNASLVTVYDVVTLARWPVKDAERVVQLAVRSAGKKDVLRQGFTEEVYQRVAAEARSFSGLFLYTFRSVRLDDADLNACYVSDNYFRVLGARFQHGRGFDEQDGSPSVPERVGVISNSTWRRRFGSDPAIAGRLARFNGVPFTIIGVTSPDFPGHALEGIDVWLPQSAVALRQAVEPRRTWEARIAGRLAEGVTREQARGDLEILFQRLRAEQPPNPPGGFPGGPERVVLLDASFDPRGSTRSSFILPLAGVLLILLLACANISNLLLARGAARAREIAVRATLGAGRRRLVRQLLTESLVLAGGSAVLGLGIAYVLPTYVLNDLLATSIPNASLPFRLEPRPAVMALTAALSVVACLACGVAPALRATRAELTDGLQGRNAGGLGLTMRGTLLSMQAAVTVVLLVGAGLLARGVHQIANRDLGFAMKDVSLLTFHLPGTYDLEQTRGFTVRLLQELESRPGRPLAYMTRPPFTTDGLPMSGVRRPEQSAWEVRPTEAVSVSPGYFEALQIPLLAGRSFRPGDAYRSVIVNEALANEYWPGESPVGRPVIAAGLERQVVGVVGNADTQGEALRMRGIPPKIYWPIIPPAVHWVPGILVRPGDAESWRSLGAVATRIDPSVQSRIGPLSRNFDRILAPPRFGVRIAAALGAIAVTLAAVGVFGVFAYVVQRRTREIGIRLALGAASGDVLRGVLGSSLRAVWVGLVVGLVGAVAGARLLRASLYGLSPLDPLPYALAALVLVLAAGVATYFPARRAMRVDPTIALRWE